MADEKSAPKALEELIARAEKADVSDIHLQMLNGKASVSFRMDGMMTPASELPEDIADRVFGRIKYLARLKTYQESLPQDGRIEHAEVGSRHDIRVATYPTITGEKIVLRMFTESIPTLDELGFAPEVRAELEQFLARPSGLLLLTGPAGSGKTTTIYACLQHLAEQGDRHVITIEDPAEQVIPGIMQTEVNEALGLDFAKAARHLLRQDPQVLVIGEIRDDETANIAVRASLTGHLVISTLHAGSCKGVFERLLAMCPDQFAAISSIELVVNQRLMRRLCADCGGDGCDVCLQTGYRGRVPIAEIVKSDDRFKQTLSASGAGAIKPKLPLREAANALRETGVVNDAELRRIFGG